MDSCACPRDRWQGGQGASAGEPWGPGVAGWGAGVLGAGETEARQSCSLSFK